MGKEDLRGQEDSGGFSQVEDRVMKIAAQYFGRDLLPYVGVKGRMASVAPTEHVHLEMRRLEEDFNFIMKDGSWRHLEFESDRITVQDLRRFREYEAYIGMVQDVTVMTIVLCTAKAKVLKRELINGNSIFRVELVRLKDRNADRIFEKLERRLKSGKKLKRRDVFPVLLSPMMSGEMSICARICRGMDILQNTQLDMQTDEIRRMQSVLYALAIKFLKKDELEKVKERIGMSILGQMIWEDGLEKGIQAFVLGFSEEGYSKDRIVEKLVYRFSLKENDAIAWYDKIMAKNENEVNH